MNIKCLFGHHNWGFCYNHGIQRGDKREWPVLKKLFASGEIYQVDYCAGCGRQSRMVNGVRVILPHDEMGSP